MQEIGENIACIEQVGAHVQRELRREQLDRLDLSALESDLRGMVEELEPLVSGVLREHGRTPETALAEVALRAAQDSTIWAGRFRKHAAQWERREHLALGVQGALGTVKSLRRCIETANQVAAPPPAVARLSVF